MPIGKDSIKKRVAKVANTSEMAPVEVRIPKNDSTMEDPFEKTLALHADEDDLFIAALELAVDKERLTTAMLQRALLIGYARAAKIIDRMEELGFVGSYEQGKGREILLTAEQLAAVKENGLPDAAKEAKPAPKKKSAPKKAAPAPKEEPAEVAPETPATAVMGNVAPETVEKVIGHAEGTPSAHVQIGSKMPSYLL